MWQWKGLFFIWITWYIQSVYGCEMDGVGQWALPQTLEVIDAERGIVFTRSTNNILGINSVTHFEGLNAGPYMDVSYTDSNFTISTSETYAEYEDNETLQSFSITVLFSCTGGSTNILVFLINIKDTNNNAPQFLPSDEYEFAIAPPVPPGFQITGCVNDIIVRDIDLTTQRIEFGIEENPYFEISFDESSTEPKEFKAVLRTTTLIRNLPEAIELRITATDVDLTGDPPITTSAVIRIQGDTDFQLPEEPIFAQPFYLANYTDSSQVVLSEPITLQQGYHEEVQFTLEGEFETNFRLVADGNSLNIAVESPLSSNALESEPILLVVRAERQDTSGATTTVVISTPAADALQFESTLYEGLIVDNVLQLSPLVLSQGYDSEISVTINSEYSTYFNAEVQGTTIILNMTSLQENVINDNIYINLEIIVSSAFSRATTLVSLAIVKDDRVTPLFEKNIYFGSYETDTGLTLETILLTQGYDETVTVGLDGEHSSYFEAINSGSAINVSAVSTIPTELYEDRIIFLTINANKPRTVGAAAVISISLPNARLLGFEAPFYSGQIINNTLSTEPILLNMGYEDSVTFGISGDYAEYFTVSNEENQVAISLTSFLPENVISENNFVAVLLTASGFHAVEATTSIIIELVQPVGIAPVFSEAYYRGVYSIQTGLQWEENIYIVQGYDDSVTFALDGDFATWFSITQEEDYVTLILDEDIPEEVLQSNNHLLFTIIAQKPDTEHGRAAISIELPNETQQPVIIRFTRNSFQGTIENGELQSPVMVILDGESQLPFLLNLTGDFASYFQLERDSNVTTIELLNPLPVDVIAENNLIVLDIEASYPEAISGYATVIFEIVKDSIVNVLVFEQPYYIGEYTDANGLQFEDSIRLREGFDDTVTFELEGDDAQWFEIVSSGNNNLSLNAAAGIPVSDKNYLIFSMVANKSEAVVGRTVIVIWLPANEQEEDLYFSQIYFLGTIVNGSLSLEEIRLEEGFSEDLNFTLIGDYVEYFQITGEEGTFTVQLSSNLPAEVVDENSLLVFAIEANNRNQRAHATIVLDLIKDEILPADSLEFDEIYYTGSYTERDGLIFNSRIVLIEGFDEFVEFGFEGESSEWFELVITDNAMELGLTLSTPIPPNVLSDYWQLIFLVTAQKPAGTKARAVIVISLEKDILTENIEKFDKFLYEGTIRDGVTQHEIITVSGYNGSDVQVLGEYANLFSVSNSQGVVTVQGDLISLPSNLTYLVLELRISDSSAVLLLDVFYSESPEPSPVVTFSSPSYSVTVDVSQTGLVGRVEAAADNGEPLLYSLLLDNDHLQQRLSIDSEGGLFLSSPANSGSYNFQVAATTTITQAIATAEVNLAVNATVICGEDDFVVPPLIIIDRDEEEAHRNLVVLNATWLEGCQYILSNRWPTGQTWLYVDANGLHTTPIDREHESIAFMALSQVQVELILECDNDVAMTRLRATRDGVWPDNLGPYDYGNSKWILTDSIPYNPRRSLVNLIVNDINDNYPIFDGKEDEPIAVGYPVSELEERILPRALIKLKASDADIGENAVIRYWSSEDELSVSPLTGYVHIRDNKNLINDAVLRVYATDRNGEGLTTSLDIMIKLMDANHIAVVTVRDAFLDDEDTVLDELSVAVGYEVRALSSAVVPHSADSDNVNSRMRRDFSSATGSSLQLYVYGLIAREPVEVDRLTSDITDHAATTVNIARSISLEDYLDGLEICSMPGHDIALLVSTIILSVLLFILITSIAVWLFLRWRKKRNYDQFSDRNSLASRNESPDVFDKPESTPKPRLQIEELIKSERRLKEMLDTPIETANTSTTMSKGPESETEVVAIVPQTQPHAPIVIQSIDKLKDAEESEDDDVFGERLKSRRKSVVTFNENVEKIIHIEDIPDEVSNPEFEVYKF